MHSIESGQSLFSFSLFVCLPKLIAISHFPAKAIHILINHSRSLRISPLDLFIKVTFSHLGIFQCKLLSNRTNRLSKMHWSVSCFARLHCSSICCVFYLSLFLPPFSLLSPPYFPQSIMICNCVHNIECTIYFFVVRCCSCICLYLFTPGCISRDDLFCFAANGRNERKYSEIPK